MTSPAGAGTGRRTTALFALGAAVATVGAVAVAVDPAGLGRIIGALTSSMLLLAATLGPRLRGARPARVWNLQFAGFGILTVGALASAVPVAVGPLHLHDLLGYLGHAVLAAWLIRVAVHVGRPGYHCVPYLDLIALVASTTLSLWPLVFAPRWGSTAVLPGLVEGGTLFFDAILITMAIELTYMVRVVTPSHTLLVWTASVTSLVDFVAVICAVIVPDTVGHLITAARLGAGLLVACALCHPSVRYFSDRPDGSESRHPSPGTVLLTMVNTTPAILAVVAPTYGTADVVLRACLVATILATLAFRLWGTMNALVAAEADSRYRATHDTLTGLFNRAALLKALESALVRNAAADRSTAVLFLDCDRFKQINDNWGHHTGDLLLVEVAHRLRAYARPSDALARQGGDEFVVVATVSGPEGAIALAERLQDAFADPIAIADGRTHHATVSFGIAVAPPSTEATTDDLLKWADAAMYVAKSRGQGGYSLFDENLALAPTPEASTTPTITPATSDDSTERVERSA